MTTQDAHTSSGRQLPHETGETQRLDIRPSIQNLLTWRCGRRSFGTDRAAGHGSVKGPASPADLDPSGGLERQSEWLVGVKGASRPSSTLPLLPRRRGRTDSPLPAIRSIRERHVCQSVSQSPWAQAHWHPASRIGRRGGRRARAEADLPDPDPSWAASGPRRKLLSLIPISIPISHVEWSRQRGTLPQKT